MKIVKTAAQYLSLASVAGLFDRHRHAGARRATEPRPEAGPAADAAAPDPGANPPLTLNRYSSRRRATSARSPSLAPPSMFRS